MVYSTLERAENDEFYATVKGENNETVWKTTDTYPDKRDAVHAVELIGITDVRDNTTFRDPAGEGVDFGGRGA